MYQYAQNRDEAVKLVIRGRGKSVKIRYCGRNVTVPKSNIPSYLWGNSSYGTPEYYAERLWVRIIGSTVEITVNKSFIKDCDQWHDPQEYKLDTKHHRTEIRTLKARIAHYDKAREIGFGNEGYEQEMTLGYTY